MKNKIYFLMLFLIMPQLLFAATSVFYSACPYGTGDIKTGSPTLTISSGIAILSVAQTGNIGAGCCIDYDPNNTLGYIAPNRLGFDSGGTTELKINEKIEGNSSGATGVVRAIEVTGGSWAGGDASGWIYFSITYGTWQNNEQINKVKPSTSSNIATADGTLQGNIGNGDTQFVIKTAVGADAANVGSAQTVNSIHHEYASLAALEAGFTDASHVNDTDLTNADVVVYACLYYDHDDSTKDTATVVVNYGISGVSNYLAIYVPTGNSESINRQMHSGTLDSSKQMFETANLSCLYISEYYTRIEGCQIVINNSTTTARGGIYFNGEYIDVSLCIIKGVITGNSTSYGIGAGNGALNGNKIYNNIFYDWIYGANSLKGMSLKMAADGCVYNNTVHNSYIGIYNDSGGAFICKNNLVNDCSNAGFSGSFDSASTHNIVNKTESDGAFGTTHATGTTTSTSSNKLNDSGGGLSSAQVGSIVKNSTDPNSLTYSYVTVVDSDIQLTLNDDIFADANFGENYTVYTNIYGTVTFEDESGDDFHLSGGDTTATGKGTDLSSDASLEIWYDVDSDERSATWGIGADDAAQNIQIL